MKIRSKQVLLFVITVSALMAPSRPFGRTAMAQIQISPSPTSNFIYRPQPDFHWTKVGGAASSVYAGAAQLIATNPSAGCGFEGAVAAYWEYLSQNICSQSKPNECLEPTAYLATRSDGRQVKVEGVYRWRADNMTWADPDDVVRKHLLPHFVLQYLRRLRNAYNQCPSGYYYAQLYNQIDYLVSQAATRESPAHAILPALVWENRYGITQGMEQAEMAAFLASAARVYASHGAREARGTMRYAFRAIESLFIPVGEHSGGVRSLVQTACAAKTARLRPCFWFHSRGVGIDTADEDMIATVLNQHLHVINGTLAMYSEVSARPDLVPEEYGTAEEALARLEDRAIGGLYQLAFSRGNNSAAPARPPSLAQFMRRDPQTWPFYFSYYRFDLSDRQFRDISFKNTCHYHTHSLKLMADIKQTLDDNVALYANSPSGQGWRLYEAVGRLFAGAGEPRGQLGSTSAIWQFWLAQQVKYTLVGCPRCKDKDGNPIPCSDDESVADYYSQVW
jgi:hypothetical protein